MGRGIFMVARYLAWAAGGTCNEPYEAGRIEGQDLQWSAVQTCGARQKALGLELSRAGRAGPNVL